MSNDLSEYMTILTFDEDEMSAKFNMLSSAMINNSWELIDTEVLENEFERCVHYFRVCKRFRSMDKLLDGKLSLSDDGFEIDGHNFETLDEIATVIKNKAFV
jgi:hypothetical protein